MKKVRQVLFLVGCLCVAFDAAAEMIAPAFSDPLKYQAVDAGWLDKPIKYADAMDADIVLSTDQNLHDILYPLVRRYAKEHKLNIVIQKGTCGISAGKLSKKQIDIGGYCCPPGEHDRLPGLTWHTLGIAPIKVIVHPNNAIDDISLAQLRAIFNGDVFDWSNVRMGNKQMIQVVARLHCKLRPGHWRLLLNDEDDFTADVTELAAVEDMIRMVAGNTAAIGYETASMIDYYEESGRVKSIGIDGVGPVATAEGKYPLYRVYNLTTWQAHLKNDAAIALVHYLMDALNTMDLGHAFIAVKTLKQHGWKFAGDELIGAPSVQQ